MKSTHCTIHSFDSPAELADNLADFITGRLTHGIEARKLASMVVSGGSTPKPLFTALSERQIDWTRVTVTLADERWVDPADPDSNERLVNGFLLRGRAAKARFIGLKNNGTTTASREKRCRDLLQSIPRPFDVVILGMGTDGHTASLFPGSPRLSLAMDRSTAASCLAIAPGNAAHERITLTLPVLLDTMQIIIHITGSEKRKVLEQAMADGPEVEMPVRAFLRQKTVPVSIYWAP